MENKNKVVVKQPSVKRERPKSPSGNGYYSYRPKNPNPKNPKDKIK